MIPLDNAQARALPMATVTAPRARKRRAAVFVAVFAPSAALRVSAWIKGWIRSSRIVSIA